MFCTANWIAIQHYLSTINLSMEVSRLTQDGATGPVSRDQILRRERGQRNIHLPCLAHHEQDRHLYLLLLYVMPLHTYIHRSMMGQDYHHPDDNEWPTSILERPRK